MTKRLVLGWDSEVHNSGYLPTCHHHPLAISAGLENRTPDVFVAVCDANESTEKTLEGDRGANLIPPSSSFYVRPKCSSSAFINTIAYRYDFIFCFSICHSLKERSKACNHRVRGPFLSWTNSLCYRSKLSLHLELDQSIQSCLWVMHTGVSSTILSY